MDLAKFVNGLKGDLLKSELLKIWFQAHELEGVDFNNAEQVNQLAKQLVPKLIKSNPQIASLIKNSGLLETETQKEVTEVIDAI